MIREIKLKSGLSRYGIEVRVNGEKKYAFAKTRAEAENKEDELIRQRDMPTESISMSFLTRAWV